MVTLSTLAARSAALIVAAAVSGGILVASLGGSGSPASAAGLRAYPPWSKTVVDECQQRVLQTHAANQHAAARYIASSTTAS